MQLSIRSLSHTYAGKPPRPALQDVNLQADSGEFIALVGPSGCGKSTLLRLVANLIQPTAGQICLDGSHTAAEVVAGKRIAWMAQSPALLPWRTVRANVALTQRFLPPGVLPPMSPDEALQRVGLADAAQAYPFTLSGGMQQRLALARMLTLPARLWLMDEPFAALDELTRERLAGELIDLWQPLRPTVLWVTHNIHEALRLADRVLVFSPRPGHIIADQRIELPRPRIEADPAFQSLLLSLRRALHQSAEVAQ
jgi:NitT/TauT family transport system ATP-binding protein